MFFIDILSSNLVELRYLNVEWRMLMLVVIKKYFSWALETESSDSHVSWYRQDLVVINMGKKVVHDIINYCYFIKSLLLGLGGRGGQKKKYRQVGTALLYSRCRVGHFHGCVEFVFINTNHCIQKTIRKTVSLHY